MEYTIVLSGPAGFKGQMIKALTKARFILVEHPPLAPRSVHAHGLPDTTDGKSDQGVGWLTVRGDDIDEAVTVAGRLKWQLRMHYSTPGTQKQGPFLAFDRSFEERLRAIEEHILGGQR